MSEGSEGWAAEGEGGGESEKTSERVLDGGVTVVSWVGEGWGDIIRELGIINRIVDQLIGSLMRLTRRCKIELASVRSWV